MCWPPNRAPRSPQASKQPITPQRLREASLSGEIENLLQWFDAAPGDTFFIPAGTVHAIGAGLTLCEIQQHSDVTYRLYDYGRPRDLHLDQALAVSHLGPYEARQRPQGELLVTSPFFTTSKLCISSPTRHIATDKPQFLVPIEGSGVINGQPTRAGDVWYLEAGVQETELSGGMTLLRAQP